MKFLLWFFRGLVFIALVGLAVKNDGVVELNFYFNQVWRAPLSLMLLVVFILGAALGLTATLATLARQWRELRRLRSKTEQPGS